MTITSVTAYAECEICSCDVQLELIEMANGTWGDDDDVELPEGWVREFEYGNTYSLYCPDCKYEVGL